MVGVAAGQLPDMEGDLGVDGKGLHELVHQLGVEGANLLGGDVQVLIVPAPAGQVHGAQDQSLIHGQAQGGVAFDAPLIPQGLGEGLPQGDADVLHGVVVVHVGVAAARQLQVHPPMAGQEGEHVVQKAHAALNGALPSPVQVQGQLNVRLVGLTRNLGCSHTCSSSLTFSSKMSICSRVPMVIRL